MRALLDTLFTRHGLRPAVVWSIVLLGYGLGVVDCLNFVVDDTFIPMRYAEHAANGQGLVFNTGERVEGYSDFLWVVLLAGAVSAGVTRAASEYGLLLFAKGAGALFGLATIVLLAVYLRRLRRRRGDDALVSWCSLAAAGVPASFSFELWSLSGLETSLCAFVVTLAVMLYGDAMTALEDGDAGRATRRCVWGNVVLVIASMVRPEQLFIAALAIAVLVLSSGAPARRVLLRALPVFVMGVTVFLAWRWSYYGQLLPNSVYAKSPANLRGSVAGARYLLSGLSAVLGVTAVGILGLPRLARLPGPWRVVLVYLGCHGVFVLLSGGDWMPGYRFLVPVIPLLSLACFGGIACLTDAAGRTEAPRGLIAFALLMLVGTYLAGRSMLRYDVAFESGFHGLRWTLIDEYVATAHGIRGVIPDGATVAIGECGAIPFLNPQLRFLDVYGLNDRAIARLSGSMNYRVTPEYVESRRPDYYLLYHGGFATPDPASVRLSTADARQLLASAAFRAAYRVERYFPGFVLYRRDSSRA